MQVGSLVETMRDFLEEKRDWPNVNYPNKGDILAIVSISPHPNAYRKGTMLLTFYELDNSGLCDIMWDGAPNFKELQPPMKVSIEEILEEELELTN